jgi:hypothetical protein
LNLAKLDRAASRLIDAAEDKIADSFFERFDASLRASVS